MTAFTDSEAAMLGKAYQRSWDKAIQEGALEVFDLDTAQYMIASRIIRLAQVGEMDEWRLARGALQHFRVVRDEQTARTARYRRVNAPGSSSTAAA